VSPGLLAARAAIAGCLGAVFYTVDVLTRAIERYRAGRRG
jgi:hypothetical protein